MLVDYSDDESTEENENSKKCSTINPSVKKVIELKKLKLRKVEERTSISYLKKELQEIDDDPIIEIKILNEEINSEVEIPKPRNGFAVRTIQLSEKLLEDPEEKTVAEQANFNMIQEDQYESIPAANLATNGLFSSTERKRHMLDANVIDSDKLIDAKKVCMDDLLPSDQVDIQPTPNYEELSQFRKKKDEDPGKNASRQHQITWLAHKAREREFQLLNDLANQSESKSARLKKYGF